jgi:FkbM family methyltransferase
MTVLDFDSIQLAYKLLLGRSLNETECRSITTALSENPEAFELEPFRRTVITSDEFVTLNRTTILPRLFPKPCVVVARTPLGQEIFVDLRQLHLGFAIAVGAFEPNETDFIRSYVKPGMKICDIGANVGYFSLIFAGLAGNSGRVFAFEPVFETYAKLSAAISRNHLENIITPYNVALSNREGESHIEYEPDGFNIGAAHLETNGPTGPGLVREKISTKKLDDVLDGQAIDFVKIDVEGAEHLVLQGAQATLQRTSPAIMIEFNDAQLRQVSGIDAYELAYILEHSGYGLFEIVQGGSTRVFTDTRSDVTRLLSATGIFNCIARRQE